MAGKVAFGTYVASRWLTGQSRSCPHCRKTDSRLIGTKFGILQLRRCTTCRLMFRWPKDDEDRNRAYYSNRYEAGGWVTEVPGERELERLLATGFKGTRHDFTPYLQALTSIRSDGRALDFGASWGYGTWQLEQAGYSAVGCEVDHGRAQFGREKLDLELLPAHPPGSEATTLATARFPNDSFDIVFTAHTLEHLPSLVGLLEDFRRILRSGGILMVVVPNCEGVEEPEIFDQKRSFAFGETHTLAFDSMFWERNLPRKAFEVMCVTSEVGPIQPAQGRVEVDTDELLVVAQAI